MKKTILALICVVATLSAVAQDAVSITHNLPATIAPGQSYDADFTINKGSVGGFAKFQLDLPFGFGAANVDSKGGNFTYENQRVKIVWVSVPSEPSFSFKFKITIPANAVNSCTVSAKFFYLENNVKKEVEMASYNMRIDGTGAVATTSTPTETVTSTPTETVTSTPTTATTTPITTYTTEPVTTNTVATTPTVSSTPTETVTSTPTTTYTTEPVATNTVTSTPTETVTSTPTETVSTTPTNTTSVTPNTITERTTSGSSDNNNSSSSSSGSGMTYKVQLGAFSNYPSKSKFPGISLNIVQEGGYYKALTGNFNSMDEAMNLKSKLASKGYDCFVVFYQNGQRVGIQK